MSQTRRKAPKTVKSLAVLDFKCDGCGAKLNCIVIADGSVIQKIAKSFCEVCWSANTLNPNKVSLGVH